jgi:thioredoxin-like negative regulator of GroEL
MDFKKIIDSALSYNNYCEHVNELVKIGKTTGNSQSESYLEYTKLNIQRMNRLDKTTSISEPHQQLLKQIKQKQIWLLIGDAWCGDCAQIIPILSKMALINETQIEFKIISRDEFPELIQTYQTNGTNSIPKLLIVDAESLKVINTWGPRPKPAIDILLHWKANQAKMSKEDFEKELHLWYAKDKGHHIIEEVCTLVTSIELD